MHIPDIAAKFEVMVTRGWGFPGGVGAALCLGGLVCMFGGGSIRRALATVNLGAIGALVGAVVAGKLDTNTALTAWAGAMVAMAVAYPLYKVAAAASAAVVVAAGVAVLAGVAGGLPNGVAVVLAAVVGLFAAALTFLMEYKALAAVYALQGSLMFLMGSLSAHTVFGLQEFPLYASAIENRLILAVCVVLPMAIGVCAQLALHDPTVKERTPDR